MPPKEQQQGEQSANSTLLPQLGINLFNGLVNNTMALIRENYAREDNARLNEEAARNADARTRALYWDLQSPQALLKQYEEAGLSPSMMFSGGGVGAQPAGGAQGAGTTGITPNTYGMTPIDLAQLRLVNAEADKTEAETDTILGDTPRGQAEIDNLIKEANNKWLTGEQKALDVQLKNIELAIKGETGQTEIDITKQQLENLRTTGESLRATLKSMIIQNKISEESADAIITYNRQRVAEQAADIFLKTNQTKLAQAGIAVSAAQVAKLFNDITIDRETIRLKGEELQINRDSLDAKIEQWGKENNLREKDQYIKIADLILSYKSESDKNLIGLLDAIIPL